MDMILKFVAVSRLAEGQGVPTDRARQIGLIAGLLPGMMGLIAGILAARSEAPPTSPITGPVVAPPPASRGVARARA